MSLEVLHNLLHYIALIGHRYSAHLAVKSAVGGAD